MPKDPINDPEILMTDEVGVSLQEAQNGLLQFDRAIEKIETAVVSGEFSLTEETVLEFHRLAVDGIRASAGAFRRDNIAIKNAEHVPPPPELVPTMVRAMCEYVTTNWEGRGDATEDAVHLSAYVMWRVNWIHPFTDGNGRTARIVSYLVMSARLGFLLPGKRTIPDQIVDDPQPYYRALEAADRFDLTKMEDLLRRMLGTQLQS